MLFMKRTLQELHCGFSKQMVEILNKHKIQFSSFDIFSDEEVRQGLKTYSNWPTYPQLYVSGELIGGLDIVKVRIWKSVPGIESSVECSFISAVISLKYKFLKNLYICQPESGTYT